MLFMKAEDLTLFRIRCYVSEAGSLGEIDSLIGRDQSPSDQGVEFTWLSGRRSSWLRLPHSL